MTLRLDPRFPLIWRSPTSIQIGVDRPLARFEGVTTADERLLAALKVGATRTGVNIIGAQSGLTKAQIARFEKTVRPALVPAVPQQPVQNVVVVSGLGPTVDRLTWRLTESGLDPKIAGERPENAIAAPALRHAALAIIVGHYVLDPAFYGLWLRRDVAHLPIVYGDTSVRIGPLIQPGAGPCLYCLERTRTDADPAWPAIASQLWGTRSAAETPFLASETATVAARIAVNLIASESPGPLPGSPAESLTIDAVTGAVTRRSHAPHPECACLGIPGEEFSAQVRRGSATAHSRHHAGRSTPTRKGANRDVPA